MPTSPLRVLIVEDELLIRWSLSEVLADAGHVVAEARDAREARLGLAGDHDVDVVLLDVRLPDCDDLTLLRQIRRCAPGAAVVVMTAYGTPELTAEALALGASAVLDKPFDMAHVEQVVLAARQGAPPQAPA